MYSRNAVITIAITLALMVGCATTEQAATTPAAEPVATPEPAGEQAQPAAPPAAPASSAPAPQPEAKDEGKVFIPFETGNVALDRDGSSLLGERIESIKASKKITVVGYCDGKEAKASDVAVQRAQSVRRELLKQGVKSAIRVRYWTESPRHGVEIRYPH